MNKRIPPLLGGTLLALVALCAGPAGVRASSEKNGAERTAPLLHAAYCFDCHECSNPTLENPCLKRCPEAHHREGPREHTPEECPEEIIIDQLSNLSDLYDPVFFAHKLHAEMGEMGAGCSVCHHYSPAGEMLACRECHGLVANGQNLRQPGLKGAYHRQCLGCHREWSHDTACEACHAQKRPGVPAARLEDRSDIMGSEHPKIVPTSVYVYNTPYKAGPVVTFHHTDHSELFGLKCVSCHRQENCSRCHDIGPRMPHVRDDPFEDCSRCHQGELDNDCDFCHSETERERFHHARRTDFVLEVFHLGVSCTECHSEGERFSGVDPNCNSCHEQGWTPKAFNHRRTGVPLDEDHVELDCADCHLEGIGQPASCGGCHDDGRRTFSERQAAVNMTE